MKALFRILAIIILSFAVQSCEKDKPVENKDFYYVQFKAQTKHYMNGTARAGKYATSFSNVTYFETILGPVEYGDKASIGGGNYAGNGDYCIYVSKNNGPFALKDRGITGASYTIDF